MRILIVVHGYPPTHTGGAERQAATAARLLAQRGHDVSVLCAESISMASSPEEFADSTEDGVRVRRLNLRPVAASDAFRESYSNAQVREATRGLIQEWAPDLVHLFSGYLMSASVLEAAQESKVPVVVSLMDYWWLCHRFTLVRTDGRRCDGPSPAGCARCQAEVFRRYRLPARVIPPIATAVWWSAAAAPTLGDRLGLRQQEERAQHLREALEGADALIAPSRYLADVYVRHGSTRHKMRVLGQGVNIDRCPVRRTAPELRVGYLGQVKRHKGVHLLLEAWEHLTGARPRTLTVYGSSAGEEKYGKWVRERMAQLDGVAWAGEFRGEEVWKILSDLDAIVVPSRWVENRPNTILEAQAMGVPVIGTNLGGIAELVEHDSNGLLFAVDSAGDLARQLQRLLDEPDLLGRLRAHQPPLFTSDDEIDQFVSLYTAILDNHRSTAGGPAARLANPSSTHA